MGIKWTRIWSHYSSDYYIENFIVKAAKPSYDGHAFKQLCVFSGVFPTPEKRVSIPGLKSHGWWVMKASFPPMIRGKTIFENLRGPVFNKEQAVCMNDPSAIPNDYLIALNLIPIYTSGWCQLWGIWHSIEPTVFIKFMPCCLCQ